VSSAAKQKGTAWETALVRALGDYWSGATGLVPRRVAQSGILDSGDLHGISPYIGQAKNYRDIVAGLREGLEGAEVQRVRAGEPYGVAFVKRPRQPTGRAYAVQTVETWARVLLRLRRAEEALARVDGDAYMRHVAQAREDDERPFTTSPR
jgi:hypothetical protein